MAAQDSTNPDLDRFDRAILAALVADARISIADLAPHIGLSSTACARRLKALEERCIITGYHAALDHQRLGFAVTVLVRISLELQREEDFEAFERAVTQCASVVRCYLMSGSDDYQLVVLCRDIADFEHIHNSAGAIAASGPHSIEFCAARRDRSELAGRAACAHIGQKAGARARRVNFLGIKPPYLHYGGAWLRPPVPSMPSHDNIIGGSQPRASETN